LNQWSIRSCKNTSILSFFAAKNIISQLVCPQSIKLLLTLIIFVSKNAKLMKFLLAGMFALCSLLAVAQYDPDYKAKEPESPLNVGLGLGMDYGGLGVKFSAFPVKYFGLFGGAGYNLVKAGLNGGAILRVLPAKKVCPYVTGMYGYNGVILVQNADQYNKVYYGPTFGGGIELHFRSNQNFMNFGLLVPLRSQKFYDDWDVVKSLPGITNVSDPLPFGISIGYHFKLQ
jgi:hypothetical protein